MKKDFCFGSENVVSVSAVCDEQMATVIRMSDYIRSETLRRCYAIPSYESKPLRWKNRYYDLIKKRVEQEVY